MSDAKLDLGGQDTGPPNVYKPTPLGKAAFVGAARHYLKLAEECIEEGDLEMALCQFAHGTRELALALRAERQEA